MSAVSGDEPMASKLLFASWHCAIDPASGAALATRDLLGLLGGRGWDCRVFCGPRLDAPEDESVAQVLSDQRMPLEVRRATAEGSDYESLAGTVTIWAWNRTATIPVMPIDDTIVEEPRETVELTLTAGAGYVIGSPDAGTVFIHDNDTTVTISASDASAAEAGPDPGEFTVTRSGDTSTDLLVQYTVAGTATAGGDYLELDGFVVIPTGTTTAVFSVVPLDDPWDEDDETVVVTLEADSSYRLGAPSSATVTIADDAADAAPVVSIVASDPAAAEAGPDPGRFTVTRTGDTSAALTVSLAVGGTAWHDEDYAALSHSVTITAGAGSAIIPVNPIDDPWAEGDETVVVSLMDDPAYQVGAPDHDTVTIFDDEGSGGSGGPSVTIEAVDPDAWEDWLSSGEFMITRTGDTSTSLTVYYTVGGTATPDADYWALSGSVVIPAWSDRESIFVDPIDDTWAEGPETVELTLSTDPAYTLGVDSWTSVTIWDGGGSGGSGGSGGNDTDPVVSIEASDPEAWESHSNPLTRLGRFTVHRTGDISSQLPVDFTIGGDATYGAANDYTSNVLLTDNGDGTFSGSLTIPAGYPSAAIVVDPVEDSLEEGDEYLLAALNEQPGQAVRAVGTAIVTVIDAPVAAPRPKAIGSLTAREVHNETDLDNRLTVTGITTTKIFIAPGNKVKLTIDPPAGLDLPPSDETKFTVGGGATPANGDFSTTVFITPGASGAVHRVAVGVDSDGDGLEESEVTQKLIIEVIKLDAAIVSAQRVKPAHIAERLFPVKEFESFETGATFRFALVGGSHGDQSMIRYEYIVRPAPGTIVQKDPGTSFHTFMRPKTDSRSSVVRFYIDANGNRKYDRGEPRVESPSFYGSDKRTHVYTFEVSNKIVAFDGMTASERAAAVQAKVDVGVNGLLKKDASSDWRAPVQIVLMPYKGSGIFPAGPDRPDPAPTASMRWKHVLKPHDITFLTWIDDTNPGYRGTELFGDVIVSWNSQYPDTIVHEIGHSMGLGHNGGPMHIMASGSVRTDRANLLKKYQAETFRFGVLDTSGDEP